MKFMKAAAIGIVATFLLNLAWENAQAPLYGDYRGLLEHFRWCAIAAIADVLIVVVLYAGVALLRQSVDWYLDRSSTGIILLMALGGAAAVLLEWWALETDRWRYSAMPVIPIVDVGLIPVLQMMVIPPGVILLMRLFARPSTRGGKNQRTKL